MKRRYAVFDGWTPLGVGEEFSGNDFISGKDKWEIVQKIAALLQKRRLLREGVEVTLFESGEDLVTNMFVMKKQRGEWVAMEREVPSWCASRKK